MEEELKELMVNIRLLQRTCQAFDYPGIRPKKYAHFKRIEEAEELVRALRARFDELSPSVSAERFAVLRDEATEILEKFDNEEIAEAQFAKNQTLSFSRSTLSSNDISKKDARRAFPRPKL